jgi:alginate O-acetyltransferase complex protein AlgJ
VPNWTITIVGLYRSISVSRKLLDLKLGEAKPSRFLSLKAGEEIAVSGTVESVSPVPRPGTVPYKDHI